MGVSLRCEYALKAQCALAMRQPHRVPVRVHEIARAQAIPKRFLENILHRLCRDGLVVSRRGRNGGFTLPIEPRRITVAQVIMLIGGAIYNERKVTANPGVDAALLALWREAQQAMTRVYSCKTLQELCDDMAAQVTALDYMI